MSRSGLWLVAGAALIVALVAALTQEVGISSRSGTENGPRVSENSIDGQRAPPASLKLAPNAAELDPAKTGINSGVVAGIVRWPDGTPAAHVRIRVSVEYGGLEGATDADGRFRIGSVPPGDRVVEVGGRWLGDCGEELRVSLGPGEERLDLEITLPWPAKRYANLALVDERRRPLVGWAIRTNISSTLTGVQGINLGDRVSGPGGGAQLIFDGPENEQCSFTVEPPAGSEGRLGLLQSLSTSRAADAEAHVIVVPDAVAVTFVVLDAQGRPVEETPKVWCGPGASADVDTANAPQHERTKLLHRGRAYEVTVGAPGFVYHSLEDWVPPGEGGTVEVRLQNTGIVRARILGVDGKPLRRGWMLPASLIGGMDRRRVLALGKDGTLEFVPQRFGKMILYAGEAVKKPRFRAEVVVRPGRVTDLGVIQLAPPAQLSGTVRDSRGRLVSRALAVFHCEDPDELLVPLGKSNEHGHFSIEVPSFSRGRLHVVRYRGDWGEDALSDTAIVEITDPSAPLDLVVRPVARLEITVDVDVSLTTQPYSLFAAWTLASGRTHEVPIREDVEDRRLVIEEFLHAGQLRVRARAASGEIAETELTTKPGEHHRVSLVLR